MPQTVCTEPPSPAAAVGEDLENLHRIIINLESAKEEITEQTEAVLWKFERLINRAYGA